MTAEATASLRALAEEAKRREIESLLSGEADANDCYIELNAGCGRHRSPGLGGNADADVYAVGGEARLQSAVAGRERGRTGRHQIGDAAGQRPERLWLAEDRGRACTGWCGSARIDSNARRHTSFASVWVYPVVDDTIEIEIRDSDLKVDTYRASGAGGQHVNKTDSAIRITHLPTGIIVACQTDRSQHRNRANAMAMLKARMYEAELQKREAMTAAQEDAKTDIGWGHQIRNYVLAPYQLVKDLRTGTETGNPSAVLDGDLDAFMAAALAARAGATRSEASAQAR